MLLIAFSLAFAVLNRCRGSRWYGHLGSTSLGRWLAMLGMGMLTGLLVIDQGYRQASLVAAWTTISLYSWSVWAWNNYWSAAIGHPTDLGRKVFPPVDWVMGWLYRGGLPTTDRGLRIWGLIAMTLRQSLAAVCIVGLAFLAGQPGRAVYAPGVILLGLPYFVSGYSCPREPILWSEYAVGAILGALVYLTVN